jgi:hypothetical protein
MGRRLHRGRNDAGSLLAATFVVAVGTGSTVFVALAIAPRDSGWLVAGIALAMLAVLGCVFMLRFGKAPRLGLGFWSERFRSHRSDGAADDYTPRIRRHRTQHAENKPITASEAKERRQTSASTWVPADKSRN